MSITCPPENFAPTYVPVLLRLVWQATQLATELARYSPRSTVAPEGDSAGGGVAGLAGSITNAMRPLPIRLYLMSGTAFSTGGCERRNERSATISASLRCWNSMNGKQRAVVRADAVPEDSRNLAITPAPDARRRIRRQVGRTDFGKGERKDVISREWRHLRRHRAGATRTWEDGSRRSLRARKPDSVPGRSPPSRCSPASAGIGAVKVRFHRSCISGERGPRARKRTNARSHFRIRTSRTLLDRVAAGTGSWQLAAR